MGFTISSRQFWKLQTLLSKAFTQSNQLSTLDYNQRIQLKYIEDKTVYHIDINMLLYSEI